MKMFWPVALFCGFLSLAVGEASTEGYFVMVKEKLEEVVGLLVGDGIADKMTGRLKQSDRTKSTKSASSSSRKTCTIEQPPKVTVSKGPGDDLIAMVEIAMKIILTDAAGAVQHAEVEIQKNCNLTIIIGSEGLMVKDCACSPSDGNVKMSLPAGLTMPETITEQVKKTVFPVIDQNFCDVVKQCIEIPAGNLPNPALEHLQKASFHVNSLEEDGKYIIYHMTMTMECGNSEEQYGPDSSDSSSSWKPHYQMPEGAICALIVKPSALKKCMENQLPKPILMKQDPSTGEVTTMMVGDLTMMEDGLGMNYTPKFNTCKTEGSRKCEEHSSGSCSVQLNVENEENMIKMSPASEGCDQEMDFDQARRDHKLMCQMANCKIAENVKSVGFPLLGNLGSVMNIQTTMSEDNMMFCVMMP